MPSRHLDDGLGFNHGQPATLLRIEGPADYDELLRSIVETGYYDDDYFATHSGYRPRGKLGSAPALRRWSVLPHFWCLAEMVRLLSPHRVLEIGCGRGDVLALLARRGTEVTGIDFAPQAAEKAWPELRPFILAGDLLARARELAAQGSAFDTLLGFDIWEHLHPALLEPTLDCLLDVLESEALCLFVIPAFGRDRVFGEQFPLEFEENRAAFDLRVPFDHLLLEREDPPIPASGHLTWAHTDWWEALFTSRGLVRETALEAKLHALFDALLPDSVKAFFLFSRGAGGAERARRALWARLPGEVEVEVYLRRTARDLRRRARDAVPPSWRRFRRSLFGLGR